MTTVKNDSLFLLRRKFFVFLPVVVVPALFLLFYALGGGRKVKAAPAPADTGYNQNLPDAKLTKQDSLKGKAAAYQQADADSVKRQERIKRENYSMKALPDSGGRATSLEDPRAGEMLRKIVQLQEVVRQRAAGTGLPDRSGQTVIAEGPGQDADRRLHQLMQHVQDLSKDSSEPDPQLEKLNGMLDKIIRIQHHEKDGMGLSGQVVRSSEAAVVAIPAVVQADQVLLTGGTLALRLREDAWAGGVQLSRDQLVYGIVSLQGDRMTVQVPTIRQGNTLIPVSLQVYDLDGLPGIHIPNSLNRESARQSADQGISSIGMVPMETGIGAEAASAGIQAARQLLSRKVRVVRVAVKAGYQVLLKDAHGSVWAGKRKVDSVKASAPAFAPPCPDSMPPFLHHRVRSGRMELVLEGLYLRDGVLWLSLWLENFSPIDYSPSWSRWVIRDRKRVARAAIQDVPIVPVYAGASPVVRGNSGIPIVVGLRAFAPDPGKELVWELAEPDGTRMLELKMNERLILETRRM